MSCRHVREGGKDLIKYEYKNSIAETPRSSKISSQDNTQPAVMNFSRMLHLWEKKERW